LNKLKTGKSWALNREKTAYGSELPIKVSDLMTRNVITISSEATVKEAVDVMNEYEIGCIIVLIDRKAGGIVTERDILKRFVGLNRDADKTKVKEIMSRPIWIIGPNEDVETALRHMLNAKIKKLPVVEDGRLLGLLTLTDIARFQPTLLAKFRESIEQTPKRIKRIVDSYIS
jgi:predicted transcriptional regulator